MLSYGFAGEAAAGQAPAIADYDYEYTNPDPQYNVRAVGGLQAVASKDVRDSGTCSSLQPACNPWADFLAPVSTTQSLLQHPPTELEAGPQLPTGQDRPLVPRTAAESIRATGGCDSYGSMMGASCWRTPQLNSGLSYAETASLDVDALANNTISRHGGVDDWGAGRPMISASFSWNAAADVSLSQPPAYKTNHNCSKRTLQDLPLPSSTSKQVAFVQLDDDGEDDDESFIPFQWIETSSPESYRSGDPIASLKRRRYVADPGTELKADQRGAEQRLNFLPAVDRGPLAFTSLPKQHRDAATSKISRRDDIIFPLGQEDHSREAVSSSIISRYTSGQQQAVLGIQHP